MYFCENRCKVYIWLILANLIYEAMKFKIIQLVKAIVKCYLSEASFSHPQAYIS